MRTAVVARPLDPAAILGEVGGPAIGASVLFVGTVRDATEGRAVTGIEYAVYGAMAERELAQVAEEAGERYGTQHIVVEHRVGALSLGEASVVIAVAHVHRAPAYDASRYIIEELKRRVPVWKREAYADGTEEWVDPTTQLTPHGGGASRAGPEVHDR